MAVSVRCLTLLMLAVAVASPIGAAAADDRSPAPTVRAARTAARQQPVDEATDEDEVDDLNSGLTKVSAATAARAANKSSVPSALSPETAAMAAAARSAAKQTETKPATALSFVVV